MQPTVNKPFGGSEMRLLIPELEMYLAETLPGFSCKRCARCCTGKLIPLFQSDIDRINPCVKERFYQKTNGLERLITGARYKISMKEGKCIFLEGSLCKNYGLRPNTCRRHPFLVTERHILVSSTCLGVDWLSSQRGEEYRRLSKDISKAIDSFLEKRHLRTGIK